MCGRPIVVTVIVLGGIMEPHHVCVPRSAVTVKRKKGKRNGYSAADPLAPVPLTFMFRSDKLETAAKI